MFYFYNEEMKSILMTVKCSFHKNRFKEEKLNNKKKIKPIYFKHKILA